MQRATSRRFLILALTVFAWLAGAGQHAAMGIRHALGGGLSPLCSVGGPKFKFTPDGPGTPVKVLSGGDCKVCAHFGAPASVQSTQAPAFELFAVAPAAVAVSTHHTHHPERRSARAPPQAA